MMRHDFETSRLRRAAPVSVAVVTLGLLSIATSLSGAVEVELSSGAKITADSVVYDGREFEIVHKGQRMPLAPDQVRYVKADDSAAREADRLRGELKETRAELARLRELSSRPKEVPENVRTLGRKLTEAVDAREKLQARVADLERRNKDLAAQAAAAREASAEKLESGRAEVAKLTKELDAARSAAAAADAKCEELGRRIEALLDPPDPSKAISVVESDTAASAVEGLVDVIGAVRNDGKTMCGVAVLQAVLRNADGKAIQTASTFVCDLAPGATRRFRMDAAADVDAVASVEVEVAEVYGPKAAEDRSSP